MTVRSVRLWTISCICGYATIMAAYSPALATEFAGARVLAVPNSSLKVAVWDETDQGGTVSPHYAVAFDGVHFSAPQVTSYRILVSYHEFDPAGGEPAVPASLAADASTHVYIVQFYTQPLDAYRAQIEALGGEVGQFMPNNGHVVAMSAAVRDQVAALPYVRWIGYYQPAYRLDPQILAELTSPAPNFEPQRYSILVHQRGPAQQDALAQQISALGGQVHFITPEGFRMEATLSLPALAELVRADEVNYIEPWPGPGGVDMNIARGPAGLDADFIQTTLGLSGEGVRGEVFDTGVRATHHAFLSPNILFHTTNSSDTNHGTSTYGEVFGNGLGNPLGKGMLPNREQGIFAYYQQVTQFGGSKTRYQHTAELVDPNGAYRAVFQTSSVGSSPTTTYTSISSEVDDYLFLTDLLSCQSQSNNGSTSSRPQAWAKNIVSVGGFYHHDNTNRGDDNWGGGASTGPAADTRIKPDLSAFYDATLCPTDSSDVAYTFDFGGTSGATPMTAGAFGLLFQMWHAGQWVGHGGGASVFDDRCHMATAKALMINSAYQYPLAGESGYTDLTRVRQGWGMANLQNLYNQSLHSFVIDETDVLNPLQTRTYYAEVATGEAALKATMVYTDPHGNPNNQSQHRINDLSLKVIAPDGALYWGNHGMSTARWTTSGGTADTKNTVENVFLAAPASGLWQIQVTGSEVVQDSHLGTPGVTDADYALVVSGVTRISLGDLNCDGVVDFDDINPFVLALSDPAGYATQYPDCAVELGDATGDGLIDFDDIDPFVALLAG